jgi:hypothetical protein
VELKSARKKRELRIWLNVSDLGIETQGGWRDDTLYEMDFLAYRRDWRLGERGGLYGDERMMNRPKGNGEKE